LNEKLNIQTNGAKPRREEEQKGNAMVGPNRFKSLESQRIARRNGNENDHAMVSNHDNISFSSNHSFWGMDSFLSARAHISFWDWERKRIMCKLISGYSFTNPTVSFLRR
jgi:hypothetical protein